MAISLTAYSNSNASSRTINVSFEGDILAADTGTISSDITYYFKISTGARQTDNVQFETKVIKDLSDLALNYTKQSATDDANAYSDVRSMIVDYTYDFIKGHTANQFLSGVKAQKPMKFS